MVRKKEVNKKEFGMNLDDKKLYYKVEIIKISLMFTILTMMNFYALTFINIIFFLNHGIIAFIIFEILIGIITMTPWIMLMRHVNRFVKEKD